MIHAHQFKKNLYFSFCLIVFGSFQSIYALPQKESMDQKKPLVSKRALQSVAEGCCITAAFCGFGLLSGHIQHNPYTDYPATNTAVSTAMTGLLCGYFINKAKQDNLINNDCLCPWSEDLQRRNNKSK